MTSLVFYLIFLRMMSPICNLIWLFRSHQYGISSDCLWCQQYVILAVCSWRHQYVISSVYDITNMLPHLFVLAITNILPRLLMLPICYVSCLFISHYVMSIHVVANFTLQLSDSIRNMSCHNVIWTSVYPQREGFAPKSTDVNLPEGPQGYRVDGPKSPRDVRMSCYRSRAYSFIAVDPLSGRRAMLAVDPPCNDSLQPVWCWASHKPRWPTSSRLISPGGSLIHATDETLSARVDCRRFSPACSSWQSCPIPISGPIATFVSLVPRNSVRTTLKEGVDTEAKF